MTPRRMIKFKIRHRKMGVHTHCRLFAGPAYEGPFALLGQFVCNEQEFAELKREMRNTMFHEDKED